MTKDEAIKAYEEKFGGWPAFLLMGASDEYIVAALTKCLETGKELEAEDPDADYSEEETMCKHEHLKAVGHRLFCMDCGNELPLEFLTRQPEEKKQQPVKRNPKPKKQKEI